MSKKLTVVKTARSLFLRDMNERREINVSRNSVRPLCGTAEYKNLLSLFTKKREHCFVKRTLLIKGISSMSFIAECCLADRDQQDQQVLETLELDFHEGKTDFVFGKMPAQPNNQVYMDGWMSALREGVRFEGECQMSTTFLRSDSYLADL